MADHTRLSELHVQDLVNFLRDDIVHSSSSKRPSISLDFAVLKDIANWRGVEGTIKEQKYRRAQTRKEENNTD